MITGIVYYNGCERHFKFEKNILKILPDSINQIRKGLIDLEKNYDNMKDSFMHNWYIQGVTTNGHNIIFCNVEYNSVNGNSVESLWVDYYYEFECYKLNDTDKHTIKIEFAGKDIDCFYHIFNLIDVDFSLNPFYLQSKYKNDNITKEKITKYTYKFNNNKYTVEIYAIPNISFKNIINEISVNTSIIVYIKIKHKYNEIDILKIIKNVCEHIFDFFRFISRKSLLDIIHPIKINYINNCKKFIGTLNYTHNDFLNVDDRLNYSNIITYKVINKDNVISNLFCLISKSKIGLDFLESCIKNRNTYSKNRILRLFISFECIYSFVYRNVKNNARRIRLSNKIKKAFEDNLPIRAISEENVARHGDIDSMCKKLGNLRNKLAHGNSNFKNSDSDIDIIMSDIVIFEMLLYSMIFRYSRLDDESILEAIYCIKKQR